jgi:hypothetical protein
MIAGMPAYRTRPLTLACCAALGLAVVAANRAASDVQQPSAGRLVAIGDIHGAADSFAAILQAAGLIGADRKWSGGTATLVQTGDYLDRGGAVRQVIDLLMELERQAKAAGGRVEVLLGHHEVLNLLRDDADVSGDAYASFADAGSPARRTKAYDSHAAIGRRLSGGPEPGSRDAWLSAHPLGFVEYVDAMGPRGRYGKWLRAHRMAATVGDTAFMHAGLAPETSGDVDDVNRDVTRAIKTWDDATEMLVRERIATPYFTLKETVAAAAADYQRIAADVSAGRPVDGRVTDQYIAQLRSIVGIGESPLLSANGPMWFRGLSQTPSDESDAEVTALLARLGVARLVVGHTPQLPGRITPRFQNRVFAIDTGMLTTFFKGGRPSALEIADGRVTAIYTNSREVLSGRDR